MSVSFRYQMIKAQTLKDLGINVFSLHLVSQWIMAKEK